MGFVTGLLAGVQRRGGNPAPLLAAAGIDPARFGDAAARVPVDRYAALYNHVTQTLGDEAFGLFSAPLPPGSFEFLTRALAGAPDLATALERAGRFLPLLLPDVALGLQRRAGVAVLVINETRPWADRADNPARVFAFEWLLRLIHALACWLVGRGLILDAVSFPYPRPAHADDSTLIYTEQSGFTASHLEARFNATLLDLPIRRDDDAVNLFLQGAPGKITTLYRADREMVLKVRDLLREALPALPGQREVAARLHLSERTLTRRLEEEGASFRAIKDALRRDLALSRLTRGDEPVARIAADLGYADSSAFYRACMAWTGKGPLAYRKGFPR
ncbi:MAG: AraC family transcriptional regulator [Rhodocyclaceae bacterium]|nr:AraC family transcriptional regulator [Rhodocyclaceae bacterium]